MAKTTTTLSSAVTVNDSSIAVASATGFAANSWFLMDDELCRVQSTYLSGTTIPCLRGQNGTATLAHVSGANVTVGLGSDFGTAPATKTVAYELAGVRRKIMSYTAAGAITLPASREDMIAIINGTAALAMTIAAPTKDLDGSWLIVVGNGAAAHTIQFVGGLSGAGSSYDIVTVNATAPILLMAMAVNGLWISPVTPAMTGTVTNLVGGVA